MVEVSPSSRRRPFAGCYHQLLPVVWSRLKTAFKGNIYLVKVSMDRQIFFLKQLLQGTSPCEKINILWQIHETINAIIIITDGCHQCDNAL